MHGRSVAEALEEAMKRQQFWIQILSHSNMVVTLIRTL